MQTPIIEYHKTRDFSNKMSVTMEFVRQNFKSLGKSILFIAGPPILLASLLMGNFMNKMMSSMFSFRRSTPTDFQDLFSSPSFWIQMAVMFVFIIVSSIATIATINNYIILYEEKRSNRIEVSEIWERVRRTFFMYLGTAMLLGVLVVAIYVLMIIPTVVIGRDAPALIFVLITALIIGIFYFIVATSLIFIIRAYERIGFFSALSRSIRLVQGKWWSTFGLIMILYLIVTISTYIFSIPYYIVTVVSTIHAVDGNAAPPSLLMKSASLVFQSFAYMCQMFLYTLPCVGIAFQYFNLVERKEARGLMGQIQTIGDNPQPPVDNEHY